MTKTGLFAVMLLSPLIGMAFAFDGECHLPNLEMTGGRTVFTRQAINNLWSDSVVKSFNTNAKPTNFPDYSGKETSGIGDIEFTLTNMVLDTPVMSSTPIYFYPSTNSVGVTPSFKIPLSFQYSYRQLSFPYMRDKGNGVVLMERAKIDFLVSTFRDTDTGQPGLDIRDLAVDLGEIIMSIDSPYSWLYDIILSIILGPLSDQLSEWITDEVYAVVIKRVETLYRWWVVCEYTYPDIPYDYRMTGLQLRVLEDFLVFDLHYLPVNTEEDNACSCAVFEVEDLGPKIQMPDTIGLYDSQSMVSGWSLRKMAMVLGEAGYLNTRIEPDGTSLFKASTMEDCFQGFTSVYPEAKECAFKIQITDNNNITIHPSAAKLTMATVLTLDCGIEGLHVGAVFDAVFIATPIRTRKDGSHISFVFEWSDVKGVRLLSDTPSGISIGADFEDVMEELLTDYYTSHLNDVYAIGLFRMLPLAAGGSSAEEIEGHYQMVPEYDMIVYHQNARFF